MTSFLPRMFWSQSTPAAAPTPEATSTSGRGKKINAPTVASSKVAEARKKAKLAKEAKASAGIGGSGATGTSEGGNQTMAADTAETTPLQEVYQVGNGRGRLA